MHVNKNKLYLCLVASFIMFLCINIFRGSIAGESNYDEEDRHLLKNSTKKEHKIWASMALCWGENFQKLGKKEFPYARAAIYASKLWISQTENHILPLLTIVLSPETEHGEELEDYIKEAKNAGATVVLQNSMWSNCVQQAQVVRMYAFRLPFVSPQDIVLTTDVDAFVIGDSVTKMLSTPGTSVWVGEYIHTEKTGGSIPMALVGMSAGQWADSLDFSQSLGIKNTMRETVKAFENWGVWDVDQIILSNAILRPDRQLCPLDKDNALWKMLKLTPKEMLNEESCYKGDLMNCHRGNWKRSGGCPWWHMLPSDREDYFQYVYDQITVHGKVEG